MSRLERCVRRHARLLLMLAAMGCGVDAHADNDNEVAALASDPSTAHRVTIDDGELVGALDGRTYLFAGIPYAKPPTGGLRFKRPERNLPWLTPRDATRFGSRCPDRFGVFETPQRRPQGEDCLYLNLWTPVTRPTTLMPVMVWLGSGPRYFPPPEPALASHVGLLLENGRALADRGVVVVTIESRRGVLGYFAHPALEAEGAGGGNQGLYDQQMALAWVQRNIARFGGDPGQVTIFGQGAGAVDACMHSVAPTSRGLFQRVIGQSGSCTSYQRTRAEAAGDAQRMSAAVGCTGADELACLRQKDTTLLINQRELVGDPIVDGALIPEQPRTLFMRGDIAPVDFILGSVRDEAVFTARAYPPLSMIRGPVIAHFGPANTEQILARYLTAEARAGSGRVHPYVRMMSDAHGVCAAYEMGQLARRAGARTWMYLFDVRRTAEPSFFPTRAAAAGDDVAYTFGAVAAEAPAVTRAMQTYWTNFAKRGDPYFAAAPTSLAESPMWPELAAEHGTRIVFAPPPSGIYAEPDFAAADCEFWRSMNDGLFAAGIPLAVRK